MRHIRIRQRATLAIAGVLAASALASPAAAQDASPGAKPFEGWSTEIILDTEPRLVQSLNAPQGTVPAPSQRRDYRRALNVDFMKGCSLVRRAEACLDGAR